MPNHETQPNRRQFLKTASLAGIGCWSGNTFSVARTQSPNEKMQITNCPEAEKHLGREYRKGWEL